MASLGMTRTMAVAVALLANATPALAQWNVTIEAAQTAWRGSTRSAGGGDVVIRPYDPGTVGLRIARTAGRGRLAAGVTYGEPDLGGVSPDAVLVLRESLRFTAFSLEGGYRVARTAGGTAIWAFAGPSLDLWMPADDDTRTRLAILGGAEAAVPLGGRVGLAVRVGAGVGGSVFEEADLTDSDGLERAPTWRRWAALALSYRL